MQITEIEDGVLLDFGDYQRAIGYDELLSLHACTAAMLSLPHVRELTDGMTVHVASAAVDPGAADEPPGQADEVAL